MAIVSISEAARLTGKDRRTIQRHIAAGKISHAANGKGIDTSELLRFYGAFVAAPAAAIKDGSLPHQTTPIAAPATDPEKEALKAENKRLSDLLEAKQETIDSLNNAMRLLEDQRHKTPSLTSEEQKKEEPKGFFQRLFKG